MPEFVQFPKIPRLRRAIVVTEKIDGTNACVRVPDDPSELILAGSRTRWITPDGDNFGFARWVHEHAEELRELGPGTHFGEWWGAGIQRRYGLAEKRFSLFNVSRWRGREESDGWGVNAVIPPACCHVVPVLGRFETFDVTGITACMASLSAGSVAAPGFMKPEGVVVCHLASGHLFKWTIERDDEPKGRAA